MTCQQRRSISDVRQGWTFVDTALRTEAEGDGLLRGCFRMVEGSHVSSVSCCSTRAHLGDLSPRRDRLFDRLAAAFCEEVGTGICKRVTDGKRAESLLWRLKNRVEHDAVYYETSKRYHKLEEGA